MPSKQTVLEAQYELDSKDGGINFKHRTGTKLLRQSNLAMVATYDFAVLGGAIGTVTLLDCNGVPATLPAGAVIISTILDVITAPTSGGSATVAFGTGSGGATADIKAATAYSSLTQGLQAGLQTGVNTGALKLAADGTMSATIATAALTAGKINVIVEYIVSI